MSKQMLIDATHTEETRVVVLEDGRLEEFDVDTSTKKQIKGNIYLAKVVRVEPSLQAAFIEYGGNRHGFLAFGEIQPDYYQIPVADREAIKEQIKAEVLAEKTAREIEENDFSEQADTDNEEVIVQRSHFYRRYKIQEVIRQGQVMLVQVVKEERGNKGAALTTYLSLAGRYSVLMPNNAKGGGVSRKISNTKERKTLRAIVDKLPIPEGMSVIIRTAGQGKTKSEIKRDYDYLMKTWMQIRKDTLASIAPKLIHREGDIVKRSLRDVFTPDTDEIIVAGDNMFKSAKAFMKILMPSQVKKIKLYKGHLPVFQEYQVESQLESIHSNIVQLRSGGYLVIDQTEALVAVDVNSGRATREHNIEETALRTNLETCDELARQLRLRDMAGLIVIDFIDMDEARNNAAVERRLKEALKKDRARIQIGKISGFGLMEMSRQRLHSSFLESSYKVCPHCGGKGMIRSVESSAMHALHILEEAAARNTKTTLLLSVPLPVAEYVLNVKRSTLNTIENRYQVRLQVQSDASLLKASDFRLERLRENGVKVSVQLPIGTPFRNDKNSEKAQSIDAIIKATREEVQENETTTNREHNRHHHKKDWKRKQKQLAAEQAALNEQRHEIEESAEQQPLQDKEHFTVVEQTTLTETEDMQSEKKSGKGKYRDRKKKKQKQFDKPETKTENLPAVHTDYVPAKVEETPLPTVVENDSKQEKRGGWWNRLMG